MGKRIFTLLLAIIMSLTVFQNMEGSIVKAASTDWMADAGYGLFIHWNINSVNADGSKISYNDAVNNFDVEAFANQVDTTGAKFVIFTIAHSGYYFAFPSETLDSLVPGRTSTRDLYSDMYDALSEKGIKMMFYYENTGSDDPEFAEATRWATDNDYYVQKQHELITEIGNRYGTKLAGWWFDVCFYDLEYYHGYYPYERFDFNVYDQVARAGNPDRNVSFNFDGGKNRAWSFVGEGGDFQAGETPVLTRYPTGQYSGVGNRQWFACAAMDNYPWVHNKAGVPTPKYSDSEVISYLKGVMAYQGAFAYNCSVYQTSAGISEPVLTQLANVKSSIRYGGTLTNDNDADIVYSGNWSEVSDSIVSNYQSGFHTTADNNASIEYTFEGTGISYITQKNSQLGEVDIYIDGQLDQTVDCYNEKTLPQQYVYTKSGLSNGSHTIKLVKKSGSNMQLDAFGVVGNSIESGSRYKLVNVNSGKVLDVNAATKADGGKVIQWPYQGGKNQQWELKKTNSGTYNIMNVNSGKYLALDKSSTSDGAAVIQQSADASKNQEWKITDLGNDSFLIASANSNKALDVTSSSTEDGAKVIQWKYGGGKNQQWLLVKIN